MITSTTLDARHQRVYNEGGIVTPGEIHEWRLTISFDSGRTEQFALPRQCNERDVADRLRLWAEDFLLEETA